ncbi:hypothetical protein J2X31_001633 [Flavobacterium arsenatis]|uniref:DUF707 domain-containing protein n=1 Tax=Flavobacterium arsenatis TaxID=1484332 RepID=A0ABU1TNS0_9FLAO|nr:hypothetical protein [Flavobacterium arsenatis]MDR6967621.1 hypothetical protein [Flavobacterium arsenatis]
MQVNVGFLVSYDYKYLKQSIPLVYEASDRIVLALDIESRTWSGNTFTIDNDFFDWIKNFDVENKIEIYKDDFYDPNLTAIQNDTRERTMLAEFFGKGNWYIQLDADELFVNFKGFVDYLRANPKYLINPEKNKVQLFLFFVNLFKKLPDGYLYVEKPFETATVATNYIGYKNARISKFRKIYLPFFIVHNTWARENEEIYFKLNNWGHNKDFDVESYFTFWKNIDSSNYTQFKNVHPLAPEKWRSLGLCPTNDIDKVVSFLENSKILNVSRLYIFGKNIAQKFKHLKF